MAFIFVNHNEIYHFLSKINSNARSQNICTSFTGVVHWCEIALKSAISQSAGIARGNPKVFHTLCWFVCFFSWMKIFFFTYLTKLEFLFFFFFIKSCQQTLFSPIFLYSKCLACFTAVLFSLSCSTTWLWPEGSLNAWYSNKLIQWVVMLEISRTTLASSLVLSLLFSYPSGNDLLMAANG